MRECQLDIDADAILHRAATKQEILDSGVTVASLFFKNVFGEKAQKALTVFVALSALGNVITVAGVLFLRSLMSSHFYYPLLSYYHRHSPLHA